MLMNGQAKEEGGEKMSSVVLDLQQEVLQPDCDILHALRMAHLIASKLKLQEFDAWLINELNGYTEENPENIPGYRRINGQLKAWNPYHGWIPVIIHNSEIQSLLCTRPLGSSIGTILELYKKSDGSVAINYSGNIASAIDKICSPPFPTNYSLHVSAHVLKSIVDQVQNCLLEWTIRLENEGVLGEGMRFTREETGLAQNLPQTINNYFGTVVNGDIQKSQVVSGDHNTVSFNYQQAEDLIQQIKEAIQNEQISDEDRETVDELITDAESKITKRKKPAIINAALSGLKDFLISAGANIASALLIQFLQQGV